MAAGAAGPEIARSWITEAKHIARHDPVRVLAEVESKRRIVGRLWDDEEALCRADVAVGIARSVLCMLASSYADRPGYREEWRP